VFSTLVLFPVLSGCSLYDDSSVVDFRTAVAPIHYDAASRVAGPHAAAVTLYATLLYELCGNDRPTSLLTLRRKKRRRWPFDADCLDRLNYICCMLSVWRRCDPIQRRQQQQLAEHHWCGDRFHVECRVGANSSRTVVVNAYTKQYALPGRKPQLPHENAKISGGRSCWNWYTGQRWSTLAGQRWPIHHWPPSTAGARHVITSDVIDRRLRLTATPDRFKQS